jgi:ubiquitin-conjugating enzyme E2 D/E
MIPESQSKRRIRAEAAVLLRNSSPDYTAHHEEGDLFNWTAVINGASETPYEGGKFKLNIRYPPNYPLKPPVITMATKIYHPNIDPDSGYIGLNILKGEWCPALSLDKVLLSIQAFISDPDPTDPVMPEIAHEFVNKREEYVETARKWTKRYAINSVE